MKQKLNLTKINIIQFTGYRKPAFTLAEVFSTHSAGQRKTAFTLAEVFSTHSAGQRKAAFTLAEVLITVGIIGVVAAMTLPSIINRIHNKEMQALFKKAYSELNQVAKQFQADYGVSVPEYTSISYEKFLSFVRKDFPKYFKNSTYLANTTSIHDLYKAMDGSDLHDYPVCDNGGLQTDGGKFYLFNDRPAQGKNGPIICVDINGKKGPNRFGYDYFEFVFTTDGFVIPMGQHHKDNALVSNYTYINHFLEGEDFCKYGSNYRYQGACAYYALIDVSPLDSSKSYWKDFLK